MPIRLTPASAVKDPGATAQGVGGGLKRFGTNLGRKAKRAGDQTVDAARKDESGATGEGGKPTSEEVAEAGTGVAYSVLGVNSAARKWAQKVGADPYTTNPILKKALTDLGKIDKALGEGGGSHQEGARRHEARAADDRHDVGGGQEGDGRPRLVRCRGRRFDVRGRRRKELGTPPVEPGDPARGPS